MFETKFENKSLTFAELQGVSRERFESKSLMVAVSFCIA